jgi:hypothetical protein
LYSYFIFRMFLYVFWFGSDHQNKKRILFDKGVLVRSV